MRRARLSVCPDAYLGMLGLAILVSPFKNFVSQDKVRSISPCGDEFQLHTFFDQGACFSFNKTSCPCSTNDAGRYRYRDLVHRRVADHTPIEVPSSLTQDVADS